MWNGKWGMGNEEGCPELASTRSGLAADNRLRTVDFAVCET